MMRAKLNFARAPSMARQSRTHGKEWREWGDDIAEFVAKSGGFPQARRDSRALMNFFQKPFDRPKGGSYIRTTDGDDALGGREAIRFSRVTQA
jgi:hypothetical protein